MCHDSFIGGQRQYDDESNVPWLIYMCHDLSTRAKTHKLCLTHSHVPHDLLIIYMCHDSFIWGVTHTRVPWLMHVSTEQPWLCITCARSHSHVPWLMHTCHDSYTRTLTHSYERRGNTTMQTKASIAKVDILKSQLATKFTMQDDWIFYAKWKISLDGQLYSHFTWYIWYGVASVSRID